MECQQRKVVENNNGVWREEQRESWWCRSAGGWGQGITRFRAKLQFLLRPFDPA